jgi:hypothetical protein
LIQAWRERNEERSTELYVHYLNVRRSQVVG